MVDVTKLIGTVEGDEDYSTIGSWEDDLDNAAEYGDGDNAIGQLSNQAFAEDVLVNGGISSPAIATILLQPRTGAYHTGMRGTGARIAVASNAVTFTVGSGRNHLTLEGVELDGLRGGGWNKANAFLNTNTTTFGTTLRQCLIYDHFRGGLSSTETVAIYAKSASTITDGAICHNNAILNCGSTSTAFNGISFGTGSARYSYGAYNTVLNLDGGGTGTTAGVKYIEGNNHILVGCLALGVTNPSGVSRAYLFAPGSGTSRWQGNAGYDATAMGDGTYPAIDNVVPGDTVVSDIAGSEDPHLLNDSTVVAGVGPNETGIVARVEIDIDGQTRPGAGNWAAGVDHFVIAGRAITGVGHQPAHIAIKAMVAPDRSWSQFDTDRGVLNRLAYDTTAAEITDADSLLSFDADGFSVGSFADVNLDTIEFMARCFANAPANGIAAFAYTGTGVRLEAPTGLSVKPDMCWVKRYEAGTTGWYVWHYDMRASGQVASPNDHSLRLNTNAASAQSLTIWNNEGPLANGSIVLGVNADVNTVNAEYVGIAFVNTPGVVQTGAYMGQANRGEFIHTGFRPADLWLKGMRTTTSWALMAEGRDRNERKLRIRTDNDAPEGTISGHVRWMSNGFQSRGAGDPNSAGESYLYLALAASAFRRNRAVL